MKYIILFLLAGGIIFTSYIPEQNDFYQILLGYSCAFGAYALLYKRINDFKEKEIAFAWIFTLMGILWVFPQLSDDVYRFYWDGKIVSNWQSPYRYLPHEIANFDTNIYPYLNSKEYYSVYPPLNQLLYLLAYLVSHTIQSYAIILRILMLILIIPGFLAMRKTLIHWGRDVKHAYLFYFNPLVIVEGIANLHIEVVMVSFISMAFYEYVKSKEKMLFPVYYALGIGVKILPLLALPIFWFRQDKRWRFRNMMIMGISTFILFLPLFFLLDIPNFSKSLDLYFRKFEFNASFYYIFRYLGYLWSGYNMIAYIGPLFAILTFLGILRIASLPNIDHNVSIVKKILMSWTLYLLLATTIHPWYVLPLVFFGILTDKKYPVLWSYFITWTYINYSYPEYHENLWVVFIEYFLVIGVGVWEIKKTR